MGWLSLRPALYVLSHRTNSAPHTKRHFLQPRVNLAALHTPPYPSPLCRAPDASPCAHRFIHLSSRFSCCNRSLWLGDGVPLPSPSLSPPLGAAGLANCLSKAEAPLPSPVGSVTPFPSPPPPPPPPFPMLTLLPPPLPPLVLLLLLPPPLSWSTFPSSAELRLLSSFSPFPPPLVPVPCQRRARRGGSISQHG